MHLIELMVHQFLQEVGKGQYKCPQPLLEKFGEDTVKHLKRQFEREPNKFSLRMSNVGQPLCILQMEKEHGRKASDIQRFILGDIFEDVMLFILRAAHVPILEEQKQVTLNIGGIDLQGTLDLVVDLGDGPEVYDIKSASDYSYKNKFNQSFDDFRATDTFGYINQLLGYASAENITAGGFIVGNKSSGEMKIYPFPKEQAHLKEQALIEIESNIKDIDAPFKRQFEDIPELWKKKPTGNRVLGTTCGFCDFKFECWDNIQVKSQVNSAAKNPKMMYYTKLNDL